MTTFNNKETYLTYRSNWKAEYNKLSEIIRDQKRQYRSTHTPSSQQYWDLKYSKDEATMMLSELKEAKGEAQRQYLASKEKELATA